MPFEIRAQRRIWITLTVLWLLGAARLFALWAHDPLIAYANTYDETRYTTCFHLYADRPTEVPPQENSPAAPYADFRFIATDDPMCYWSSELLFQGLTVAVYRISERVTGAEVHSVRWIGALRIAALLALFAAFSIAWLRRGQTRAAIANAALLPLVFSDPGNTLYLNTFYAEWTALLAAYALFALIVLWRDDTRSRLRFVLLALAAFALATSKIQHLLLPLALAVVLLALDRLQWRRTTWRTVAVLLGSLAGLYFQFVQMQRDDNMMQSIRQFNAADVVFTALLPSAAHPAALLDELGIDPACVVYSGKDAWQLPGLPDRVCSGLINFTRGKELVALLRHPDIAGRLAWRGVLALDPWVAQNIGHVEGRAFAKAGAPGIGRALHASPLLRGLLLALPFASMLLLFLRRRWRTSAFEFAALTVVLMLVTLVVTVLGDGLADTAKQGHLIINAALAFAIGGGICRLLPRRLEPPSGGASA